jgi:hypothetical protein
MKKILAFVLARFPVVKRLKSRKHWIVALSVVLAALIAMVEGLRPLFPEAAWLADAHALLLQAIAYLNDAAGYLGL